MTVTTDNEMTIHEQAHGALTNLNWSHPDFSAGGLNRLLERIGGYDNPNSPDAVVIQRAMDWLEEIAIEITKVEDLLVEANFSFGKIEK